MKIHKLRASIAILSILLMLTSLLFPVLGTNFEEGPQEIKQKPTGYLTRDPIRINNNTGFNTTNGVLSGAGTQNNPYIIGGWDINGSGNGSCIFIGNTTAHFVINNSYFHEANGNSGQYYWDSGLVLYNVSNATLTDNNISSNGGQGIYIMESHNNCAVSWNNISWNWKSGLYLNDCKDSIIHNNTLWQNNQQQAASGGGIQLANSDHITVKDNYMHDNPKCGISLYPGATYNHIENNRIIFNCGGNAAINIESGSNYNTFVSNNVSNNTNYPIRCEFSDYNVFINNTITGNNNGVYFSSNSDYNSMFNNTLKYNNKVGGQGAIFNYASINLTIINNTISDNFQNGIYLGDAKGSVVSHNIISYNDQDGIYLDDNNNQFDPVIIDNNTISNNNYSGIFDTSYGKQTYKRNIISNNNKCGINLSNVDFGNITHNTFLNNTEFGVKLDSSIEIIIHHNNFIKNNGSGIQGFDSGTNNYWNDTNSRGNYWDNYENFYVPPATSNGYIWDTPYDISGSANSNDSYPLAHIVEFDPPVIVDLSPANGETGHKFVIKCSITDDSNVSAVYVFYWFGNDTANAINVSMVYNSSSGYWEYEIMTLPQDKIDQLKYNISAVDPNSNWNSKQNNVTVDDIIPPTAVAGSDVAILQGERAILNASLSTDNIGIIRYTWHLMSNGNDFYFYGKIRNILFNSGANWYVELLVEDAAGNNDTDYLWVNVSDITKPQIYDPIFPEYVNITEQIDIWISGQDPMVFDGIDTMKLVYTDLNGTTHNVTMTQAFFTQWLYQIPGFPTPGTIKLFFWANDTSGNWNVSEVYYIDIIDNILPEILDLNYPSSANIEQEVLITTEVDDNIGIFKVKLNYTDTSGITHNVSMTGARGDNYNYTIPGQSSTGMVKFYVWVVDVGNNSVRSKTYEIQIIKKHVSVKLPEINWVSIPSKVNINKPIEIVVNVYDELGIDIVYINYSNVYDVMKNVTMKDLGEGDYGFTIPNQTSAGYIDVYVTAKNSQDAWNRTKLQVIEIIKEIDDTKPRVLSTTPNPESTKVKTNVIVSIIFSESMNASSINSGLLITPTIDFKLTWLDNFVLLKIAFPENLSYETRYNITIGLAAKDLAGNRLEEIYLLSFTTEKAPIPEIDKDNDGIDDSWELEKGLDPNDPLDANYDNDSDNLTNLEEFNIGTEPFISDTDGDKMPDGWEYGHYPEVDPLAPDADEDVDGDFFNNFDEYEAGTNPTDDQSKPTIKKKDTSEDDYSVVIAIIILVIIILILFLILIKRMRKPKDEKEGDTEEESEESAEYEEIECPECGTTVGAGETECPDCGSELEVEDEEEPEPADEELTEEEVDEEEPGAKELDEEEPTEDEPIDKESMDEESKDEDLDEE